MWEGVGTSLEREPPTLRTTYHAYLEGRRVWGSLAAAMLVVMSVVWILRRHAARSTPVIRVAGPSAVRIERT
jgi:predicted membrane chloride channel (bestrophin family)